MRCVRVNVLFEVLLAHRASKCNRGCRVIISMVIVKTYSVITGMYASSISGLNVIMQTNNLAGYEMG